MKPKIEITVEQLKPSGENCWEAHIVGLPDVVGVGASMEEAIGRVIKNASIDFPDFLFVKDLTKVYEPTATVARHSVRT